MKKQKKADSNSWALRFAAVFIALLCLLAETRDAKALGEGALVQSSFFDKQKIYTDELYVLKDFLEFSVFDLAEMEVFDQSGTKKYVDPQTEPVATGQKPVLTEPGPQTLESGLSAEAEIRKILPESPKFFFKALKSALSRQAVPVTVYATEAPDYANPIKLYVKIKKIHLHPVEIDREGNYNQPLEIRIYGQIKDKRSGKILTRYYDSARGTFTLKKNQAAQAFELAANDLMAALASFLKTRY